MKLQKLRMIILAALITSIGITVAAQPDWSVNPNQYVYSMTITGKITPDGYFSTDENDMIAAFDASGTCVGLTNVKYLPALDDYYIFLMIYSNEPGGIITFKLYDASQDAELEAKETVNFSVNGIVGSVNSTFLISLNTLSSESNLLSYTIPRQEGVTQITGSDVYLQEHWEGDLTDIAAEFTLSEGAKAYINGIEQTSGDVIDNFYSPIEYLIVSADNSDSTLYTVHVTTFYESRFLSFTIPLQDGDTRIEATYIYLKEDLSGDLTGIVPDFTLTEGAKVYVNGVEQTSGVSMHDFHSAREYKVVAADKSDSTVYTVRIVPKYEAFLLSFTAPHQIENTQTDGFAVSLTMLVTDDLTGIVPVFTLSAGARATVNGVIQTSGVSAIDFSSPVEYRIIAADNSISIVYRITIIPFYESKVISFFIPNQVGETRYVGNDIYLMENWDGDLTGIVSGFTLSGGAKAYVNGEEQTAGVSTQDFLTPVAYKIVAADKSDSTVYMVHVTSKYESSFLQFSIPNQSGDTEITGTNIYLKEHWSGDLTGIVPEFMLTEGAKAYVNGLEQISGVNVHDFLSPVEYKVVASDKSDSTIYTVEISTKYESEFLAFSIPSQDGDTQISGTNISLKEICDGDLTGIVPEFILSEGAKAYVNGTEQISGVSANDFTSIVEYKIVAADKSDSSNYRIYITSNCKSNLLSFSIPNQVGETEYADDSIYLTQHWSGELSTVIPEFILSDGAKAYINGVEQISGETVKDFLLAVEYEIVAADNSKTRIYTVSISTTHESSLLTFTILGQAGETQFSGTNVSLMKHWTGDLTDIVPDFTLAEGAAAYVNGVEQTSGVTVNDFTTTVEYKVIAVDKSDSTVYRVSITPFYDSELLTFTIPNQVGETQFAGNDVSLMEHWSGDLTGIVPEFALTEGATVYVNGVEQTSGMTANDFTTTVEYKVVAADKSDSTVYQLTVTPFYDSELLTFSIPEQVGQTQISGVDVYLHKNLGEDFTGAIPDFTLAEGATAYVNGVEQTSGVTANDFTTIVEYKVVAADKSDSTVYMVSITPFYDSKLLTFSIADQIGQTQISGTDISLQKIWSVDLDGIIPDFTVTDGASVYVNGVEQISGITANNFLLPLEYKVVVADKLDSTVYTVTIALANDIPTDILLSTNSKAENSELLLIGVFDVKVEDPDEEYVYSLEWAPDTENDYFSIEQNKLFSHQSFDFEEQSAYTIFVKADDNNGGFIQKFMKIEILDINDPPTDISLSTQFIDESAEVNTVVAVLSAEDQDAEDVHEFSLVSVYGVNGIDNNRFRLMDNSLILMNPLNYEQHKFYDLLLQVSDKEGVTFEKSITIQISDVNETPEILTSPVNYILQNEVYVFALQVRDSEGDEISISFEDLPAWLNFNKNTGLLSGIPGNEWVGEYSFTMKANDGNTEATQQVFITVLNVNDPPEINNYPGFQYFYTGIENTVALPGDCITDPDIGDELSFQLSLENNSALPEWLIFDPLTLTISGNPTGDEKGVYSLKLTATDKGRLKEWLVFNLEVSFPTAIGDQTEGAGFRVYPNPVESNLYIDIPQGNGDAEINISNIAGQAIKTMQLSPGISVPVSMKGFQPGIYIVRFRQGELQQIQKIVKK